MKRLPFLTALGVVLSLAFVIAAPQLSAQSDSSTVSSKAVVPRLVRFSGTVRDASAKPLRGPVDVTFSLYAIEAGGEALWFETQTVEADAQGRYTVLLGAMHPDGLPMDLFTSGEARWLGVQVARLSEQPRILLVAVPYALKAADAETLGGKPATAFVASDQLKDQVRDEVKTQVTESGSATRTLIGTAPTPQALGEGQSSFICNLAADCVAVTQSGVGVGLHATTPTGTSVLGELSGTTGAAVYGRATATTGAASAVQGDAAAPSGVGVLGRNFATTGLAKGLFGRTFSTSGIGMHGDATATSGPTRGVWGSTVSTGGVGVWGQSAAASGFTTGVAGTVASTAGVGVLGQANATSGPTIGAQAKVSSPAGTAIVADNTAAGGKLIIGRSGTPLAEKFSVTGSGNVVAAGSITGAGGSFAGTVTGTAFVGDGSGLTVDGTTVAALLARIRDLQGSVEYLTPPGGRLWSSRFGSTNYDEGQGIAVDVNGDVLVTGHFKGTVDFGGGPLTSAGSYDIFIAKFSGVDGTHLWSKRFGATGDDDGIEIAADGGNVLVTGSFYWTVDFGGGPLLSAGNRDIFVAKYSGADGAHLWSKRFGGTDDDQGVGIAVDWSGSVLVTGFFAATVSFGGGPLTSAGGPDIFVAKFSGVNGAHLWSQRLGATSYDSGWGIAADGIGSVLVTGAFNGTVDFGGGPLTSAGGPDIFVAKFSGVNGAHLWSKRFGSTNDDWGQRIAADGSGNVLVTGHFSGTVDFGGGDLISAGGLDIFVAKFLGAEGAHLWSKRFGSTDDDHGLGIRADGSGNVLVTGEFSGTVDFGGGGLSFAGLDDIFVAKYSGAEGAHLWSKRFGSTNLDIGGAIAADGSGNVLVTGVFQGTVDFGGEALTSAGQYDMFVLKLRR